MKRSLFGRGFKSRVELSIMSKTTNMLSHEVRKRMVCLIFDNRGRNRSRWQAILSIAAKVGSSARIFNVWVKKAETH